MTESTVLNIVVDIAFATIGFSWGFLATYKFMVLPARKQTKKILDMSLESTQKTIEMLQNIVEGVDGAKQADGSMLSPLQIKREDAE